MGSVAENRAFFNEQAEGWSERCWQAREAREPGVVRAGLQRLVAALDIAASGTLLDVGCGDGVLVPHLLGRLGPGGRLIELDVAEKMIACNRRRHHDPRLQFVVADVADCALATESIDGIVCFSCFPHFADPRGVVRALAGLLRPGGWLAVSHLSSSAELNAYHTQAHPAVGGAVLPTAPELAGVFAAAGLSIACADDEPAFYLVLGRRARPPAIRGSVHPSA
ncbi:MAG: Phthiotriol/phenolphthiotriol dimycocerosates methyltransferase [Lentisphaerae bacterium ADurb.BinA184]|nr:MAG: Phthiotriol/phenolphthiotriol dimycocerosates methyltransferase [Lentisphaerae bacterium ADurb.BinA184]